MTDKASIGFGTWDGVVSATSPLDHRVKGRLGSSSEDLSPKPGPRGKADCAAEHRDSATYTVQYCTVHTVQGFRGGAALGRDGIVPKMVKSFGSTLMRATGDYRVTGVSWVWGVSWRKKIGFGEGARRYIPCTDRVSWRHKWIQARNPLCVWDTLWGQVCKSRLRLGMDRCSLRRARASQMGQVAMLSLRATRGLDCPPPIRKLWHGFRPGHSGAGRVAKADPSQI
jgi:hypothetical protein